MPSPTRYTLHLKADPAVLYCRDTATDAPVGMATPAGHVVAVRMSRPVALAAQQVLRRKHRIETVLQPAKD
jgi:hypothetical protein